MSQWTNTTLGAHIDLLSGYAFKSNSYSQDPDDIKLLRGDNIVQGGLRWEGVKRWPSGETGNLTRYQLSHGDIVLAMDRPWINAGLKCSQVTCNDLPCLLVQRVARIRGTQDLETTYIYQTLHTNRFTQYVKGVQTETAIPHISSRQIREFPIHLPPIPEQRKIAEILSTWDRGIELTEKMISAKQKRKQALMQKLLTGEVRFSEFEHDPWREFTLGSLGTTFSGLSGKTKADFGTGLPYVTYKNIYKNSAIDISDLGLVDVGPEERQAEVQKGDIFFTTSSETPDEVAISSVLLNDVGRAFLNSFCFGFRLHDHRSLLPEFARFYLRGPTIRREAYRLAQGATRYNISKTNLMKVRVKIPSVPEQRQIADFLDLCEQEISTLQHKKEVQVEQKKGLMQQLLTGKVRVKVGAEMEQV